MRPQVLLLVLALAYACITPNNPTIHTTAGTRPLETTTAEPLSILYIPVNLQTTVSEEHWHFIHEHLMKATFRYMRTVFNVLPASDD
jgi:hypothetical protein